MNLGNRNYWCDCIRGYAILLVCLAHVLHVEPFHTRCGFLTNYFKGDTGVFLFYVLSGFLVTAILDREVSGQTVLQPRLRATGHFFARRLFRLQPSHLLFLGCYALLPRQPGGLHWWALVFPLSNWFSGPYLTWHLKTLHIEELYYLTIGTLSTLFWKRLRPILWGILVLGPLGRVAVFLAMKQDSVAGHWLWDRYLPFEAFAAGGLFSLYLGEISRSRIGVWIQRRAALSFVLAMAALLTIGVLRPIKPFSYFFLLTWPMLFSGMSLVMIFAGLEEQKFPFATEWLRKLGLASYTVYLFQQLALGPWQENFQTRFSWPLWSAVLVGTSIFVPAWYWFVEKPVTDLGARLFPRVAASASRLPAAVATLPEKMREAAKS